MTVFEHIKELRTRLISILVFVISIFLVLFFFRNDLYTIISLPLLRFLPDGSQIIATEVSAPLTVPIRLAFMTSVILSMPVILHQIWGFISPGLYAKEKKFAFPFLVLSIFLFIAGILFAYFVVLPVLFIFFINSAPIEVQVMTDMANYLSFTSKTLFIFGIIFETPIVVILLILSGLISRESLIGKRRYVVIGCFVAGMLLSPPDIFSQSLMALPLWMLYELGLLISKILINKKDKSDDTTSPDSSDEKLSEKSETKDDENSSK